MGPYFYATWVTKSHLEAKVYFQQRSEPRYRKARLVTKRLRRGVRLDAPLKEDDLVCLQTGVDLGG